MTNSYIKKKADLRKCRPWDQLYIALADMDFSWYPGEVEQVKKAWLDGAHIVDIAVELSRNVDEVAVLVMDLARGGKITTRSGGVFGKEWAG